MLLVKALQITQIPIDLLDLCPIVAARKQNERRMNDEHNSDLTLLIDEIRRQLRSLRFGVVQIIVHDSKVVQIERTERIRFAQKAAPATTQASYQFTGR